MNDTEQARRVITKWMDENVPRFFPYARAIWSYAELAGQETRSASLLCRVLRENGFDVRERVADMPTAFVARWGDERPVIAISCEYDALPGLSQQLTENRQPLVKDAPGHGCGHNLLGVGGIMAAVAIKEWLEQFHVPGTVVLLGTPGEEICLGKPFMARARLFEGLDAILDWHPWTYNLATYDVCNAYFSLKFHFAGRSAHGNAPWHGRSALDAALLMGHAIELLREHIPPGNPDAAHTINYTISDAGPEFPNVVPDRAVLWVIGRLSTAELVAEVMARVDKCAEGAALATGTAVEREFISATHEKLPNQTVAEVVHRNFQQIGPPRFSEEEHALARRMQRSQGARETGISEEILLFGPKGTALSDNSEFSWFAPFATVWVAAVPPGLGWHNWQVTFLCGSDIGRKAMVTAAKVLAASAAELFLHPETLAAAKQELAQRLAERPYRTLIPEEAAPPVDLNRPTMDKYRDLMHGRYLSP
ncbi:MAG: amidohydrolase [Thermodesulfobacteriota bacterium]